MDKRLSDQEGIADEQNKTGCFNQLLFMRYRLFKSLCSVKQFALQRR